ncbi:MAG: hypothetical protein ABSG79_16825 [Bryobacteraceae bacterium]
MPLIGNWGVSPNVYPGVTFRLWWAMVQLGLATLGAAPNDYLSAKQKFDSIESGRLRAGSRLELSVRELDAYAERAVPEGVRNPRLQLVAPGMATGIAMVDFGKLRRALGYQTGWLMSKLLDGDRPVSVTARIRSAGGRATVDLQRVEISGVAIDGRTLDFLIQNVLLPLYPDAVLGRPFDLGHRIEKLDVGPAAVAVFIGR